MMKRLVIMDGQLRRIIRDAHAVSLECGKPLEQVLAECFDPEADAAADDIGAALALKRTGGLN